MMFNRNKISHSIDQKSTNKKIKVKDLSTWINNYEIQAYATEEMKEEIKELLLEVYNYDKDIRDYFFKKYVSIFSDILNLRSNPRDIDCIFKEDIPYDIPEKIEFIKYIENRNNKLLDEEKNKKKNNLYCHNNYWSEDKKIKYRIEDYDNNKFEYKNIKRDKQKKEYLSEKKRNNSKIRDYAKARYQMINKYNNIFVDNNDKNKIKVNKINENNSKEKVKKDMYYAYNNPSMFNFRQKYNKNKNNHIDNNKKNLDYINIPRLLLINKKKKNDKNEIKIYSLNNIMPNNEREIKTYTYNKKNLNSRYNAENANNHNNSEIKIEKELYIDKSLSCNVKDLKKEDLNNIYNNYEINEDSLHKTSDEYSQKNEGEIKKINVSGVNYKISGYGPKKVEINKQTIYEKNINDINKKDDDSNKKINFNHKKITMIKNLEEDNVTQKIEKDIKSSKTRLKNINLSKDAYINRKIGKKINEVFNYNGKDHYNKYYEVSLVKEDETFGIEPFLLNKIFKKKNNNNEYFKLNNVNNHISYNERRKRKMENKVSSNNKKIDINTKNSKENGNNNINNEKCKSRTNWRDNKYKYNSFNTNVNISNGMNNKELKNEKKIDIVDRKSVEVLTKKEIHNMNDANINDKNGMIGSLQTDLFRNKRKRFHRVVNSSEKKKKNL